MVETSGVRALPSDVGYEGETRSEDQFASPFDRWERSFREPVRTRDTARPSDDVTDTEATSGRATSGRSPTSSPVASTDATTGTDAEFGFREKELARRRRQRELAETARILNGASDARKSKGGAVGATVARFAEGEGGSHGRKKKPRSASDGSVSFLEDSLPDPEDLLRSLQETEWRIRHSGYNESGAPDFADSHDPGPLIEAGELRLQAAPLPFEVERAEVVERGFVSGRTARLSALVLIPVLAVVGYLALPERSVGPVADVSSSGEIAGRVEPSSDVSAGETIISAEAPAVAAVPPQLPVIDAPDVPAPILGAETSAATTTVVTEAASTGETVIAARPAAEASASAGVSAEPQPRVPAAVEAPEQTTGAEVARTEIAAVAGAASERPAPPTSIGSQRLAGVTSAAVAEMAAAGAVAMPAGERVASVTAVTPGAIGAPRDVVGPLSGQSVAATPSGVALASVDPGSPVIAASVVSPATGTPLPRARAVALGGGDLRLRPVSDPMNSATAATSVATVPSVSDLRSSARAVITPTSDPVTLAVADKPVLRAADAAASPVSLQASAAPNEPLASPQPISIVGVVPDGFVVTASLDGGVPVRPMARKAIATEPSVLAGRPDVDTLAGRETVLAPGAQISLFAPGNLSQSDIASVVDRLAGSGFAPSEPSRVGFSISQSNIRYYHAEDAAVAAAVAEASGALLRDFTGKASVPPGTIELWLAGDGGGAVASGKPAAKKTVAAAPARQRTGPSEAERTARLRSQVLSKLRSATSQ
ncbi:hypothetical protein [Tropicimonas aquimaris]|uniref:SPOR domain-containing protein n=1 Tax=Tropicimonas aquimaris TaxID=914152 RepID=A0ABW3ITR4_9RHOB